MFPNIVLAKIPKTLIAKYVGAHIAHALGIGVYAMFGFMGYGNIYETIQGNEALIEFSFNEAVMAIVVAACCLYIVVRTGKMIDDLWVNIIKANKKGD